MGRSQGESLVFDLLSEKIAGALSGLRGSSKITSSNVEEVISQVKDALLEADVNYGVVKSFVAQVQEQAMGERVVRGVNPDQQFIKIVQDQLAKTMGEGDEPLVWKNRESGEPLPVLILGLNGAGKTTFTAKLAHWLKEREGLDPLVVPADTFRPAAKDQLQGLCREVGVECLDTDLALSPERIAAESLALVRGQKKRVVIIDTAGRLHVDEKLMEQLAGVKRELAPHRPESFLVADAMTGQEAVGVAQSFHREVGLTGVVLSKMDSDARGGAALSMRAVTGVPIRFISQGEKVKDLEVFHPDRLASRILDMGDVVSLVEKAEQVVDEREAERLAEKIKQKRFTLGDFVKQMETISKMGSMGGLLKMLPGMGSVMRQMGDPSLLEQEMKRIKVMIGSMTPLERDDHKILDKSRVERIARGSGTQVHHVQNFLGKFRQMEKMMAGMMGAGGGLPHMGKMMAQTREKKPKGKSRGKGKFGGGYFW